MRCARLRHCHGLRVCAHLRLCDHSQTRVPTRELEFVSVHASQTCACKRSDPGRRRQPLRWGTVAPRWGAGAPLLGFVHARRSATDGRARRRQVLGAMTTRRTREQRLRRHRLSGEKLCAYSRGRCRCMRKLPERPAIHCAINCLNCVKFATDLAQFRMSLDMR